MSNIIILGASSGSSSTTQSLTWTYTAGAIGPGLFTTNNASIDSTATITFHKNPKGSAADVSDFFTNLINSTSPLAVSSSTSSGVFAATAIVDSGGNIQFTVSSSTSGGGNWAVQDYAVEIGSPGGVPVSDATYTMGIGVTQNGTMTTKGGVITAVQEAS